MTHGRSKFVVYRDLEDGYRRRLRSAAGETLAASAAGLREKAACDADMRAFMDDHGLEVEVLDATVVSRGRAL
jgi:uncharacterized protein YegP (UPF0339 family)